MKKVLIISTLGLALLALTLVPFGHGLWASVCFLGALASSTVALFVKEGKEDRRLDELQGKIETATKRLGDMELRVGLQPRR